jgi:hypothetical protein
VTGTLLNLVHRQRIGLAAKAASEGRQIVFQVEGLEDIDSVLVWRGTFDFRTRNVVARGPRRLMYRYLLESEAEFERQKNALCAALPVISPQGEQLSGE